MATRTWLADKRAYRVYAFWLRKVGHDKDEYGPIEHFRVWANRTANHFFNIQQLWRADDLSLCCTALGIECPESYIEASFTEDEGVRDATRQPQAPATAQGSQRIPGAAAP